MKLQDALQELNITTEALNSMTIEQFTEQLKTAWIERSNNVDKIEDKTLDDAIKTLCSLRTWWLLNHKDEVGLIVLERANENTRHWTNFYEYDKKFFLHALTFWIEITQGKESLEKQTETFRTKPLADNDALDAFTKPFENPGIRQLAEMSRITIDEGLTYSKRLELLLKVCEPTKLHELHETEWCLSKLLKSPDEQFNQTLQSIQGQSQSHTTESSKEIPRSQVLTPQSTTHEPSPLWVKELSDKIEEITTGMKLGSKRLWGSGEESHKYKALLAIKNHLVIVNARLRGKDDPALQEALYRLTLSICDIHRNTIPNFLNKKFKPHSYVAFSAFLKDKGRQDITPEKLTKDDLEKLADKKNGNHNVQPLLVQRFLPKNGARHHI